MALSATVQEALWWKRLRARIEKNEEIVIYCDNQSAIAVSKNGGFHSRTKHIDIRHHFIRDTLDRGDVEITYINTEVQVADGLTKPLQKQKLELHRAAMGLQDH